ncbi:GNAT family N-acetyltransferase [uncultured Clostridium sp.]|uniref:GNAT family N-acetyltransferase n=1 Tax=uncultured Clostridium sp. TaxID=59620 RepID=UPI0026214206|nr:GNAT family N-acetyltransferase [uncultured Clostridium sp.]
MKYNIRDMEENDWNEMEKIYADGIKAGATFQKEVTSYEYWNKIYLKKCRLVICEDEKVIGWTAVRHISPREAYNGVVELSIYIDRDYKGKGVGGALLNGLVKETERCDIWSIQAVILRDNLGSLRLHEKCGFRTIGIRDRVAKLPNGDWMDVVLMERRSKIIF